MATGVGERLELLTRGTLAARSGCNMETIRYYERIGILPPPPRSAGGHRLYGHDLIKRLTFVRRSRELGFTIEEIRQLRAPLGIWGCNGNHEIYARVEDLAQSLFAQAGMKLLRGENAQATLNGAQFNLIGVDYQRERTSQGHKMQTLVNVERLVRRDMPNILLSHNPNSFPRAAELGIELSLAGHTHGGQIQVEILDHRLSPARFITDYIAGLYQRPLFAPLLDTPRYSRVDGYSEAPRVSPFPAAGNPTAMASLYVNRGLGTVGAPVRIGVPPEITLIVLRCA